MKKHNFLQDQAPAPTVTLVATPSVKDEDNEDSSDEPIISINDLSTMW